MTENPDDWNEAERETYWLEVDEDGYRVMKGETKEESEEVGSGEGWFAGIIQSIDENVGDYDDSRLYTLRHEDFDRAINFWGKVDFDTRVDNAGLGSGDEVAFRQTGTEEVADPDSGNINEMGVYELRYR